MHHQLFNEYKKVKVFVNVIEDSKTTHNTDTWLGYITIVKTNYLRFNFQQVSF